MGKRIALVVALLFSFLFLLGGAGQGADNAGAFWVSDPAERERLAPETSVQGYSLRPPLGYTLRAAKDGFAHTYTWRGAARADGCTPEIIVVIIPAILGIPVTDPQHAIKSYLQEVRHRVKTVNAETPVQGSVNGRTFWRTDWNGAASASEGAISMQGFVYATRERGAVILLGGHDDALFAPETLTLAQASALTFHRR